ncbi:protein of unknown function [Taphrina deformans PYCC 5710]|uniref:RRM domain-containing protein n=1 Tax=Taphrina deformans (strain PYCC 5710 / ATCC 11124 / CBS 356.35 / IMI 108563 / JCM 9778 / NBRC 8474) TaxID=1097556 RepID=R4XH26_TAPDE|nr:protein of unknown function [Taphrina deformans PYCC 5710]|eukprot:CCG83823.1 protein of unknown function [Taphrina deformans PYCC 5710]
MVSAKKQAFLDKKRKLNEDRAADGSNNDEPYIPLEQPATKKIKTSKPPSVAVASQPRKASKKYEKPAIDSENKNSTLFIRNLSFKTTQEQLEAFFSAVSPVKHTVIITNPETKVSLGYGFVSFATPEDAATARSELAMEKLDDRLVKIDFAEKRARKDDEKAAEKASRKDERVNAKKEAGAAELIVRNLSFKVRDPSQLRTIFEKYGGIKDVRIPRGAGAKMMGFGFVVFKKREHAEKAIQGVNGTELDGRTMAVDWSVKKEEAEDVKEENDVEIKEESDLEDEESDSDVDDSGSDSSDDEFDEVEEAKNPSSTIIKNEDSDDDGGDSSEEDQSDTPDQRSSTLFIRNLLFETTEQEVYQFFRPFGPLRYARIVKDHFTGRSRGTAFVAYVHVADAQECLRLYQTLPKHQTYDATSLLLSEERKEGVISKFILAGRLLDIQESLSRDDAAKRVDKNDATKRAEKGKGVDKRNLFLLNEGRIGGDHPLLAALSESDKAMRSASYTQRKSLISRNPGLHLSLTRLSVRNLPRHVGDRELKYLARQSIVGFGQDVKAGLRAQIGRDETARDAGNKGSTGVVKQAKVVLEKDGSRSRGYGFLSFSSHRFALMALRWLNARQIGADLDLVEMKNAKPLGPRADAAELPDDNRKRRLIVEFAIENISVVKRRAEKETGHRVKASQQKQLEASARAETEREEAMTPEEREKAKVGRIISKKRMIRKGRK